MKYYDGGCLFATVSVTVPSDVYVNAEEAPSTSAESSCMFVPQVDPSSPFHSVRLAGGLVIRLEVTCCYTYTHTYAVSSSNNATPDSSTLAGYGG